MQTTAAVTWAQGEPFTIEELDIDEPRPDEIRVRMVATGVCHTDANIRDQIYPTPLPAVLGHEGAGVVESVGSAVNHIAVGDHVVLSSNSCGVCRQCVTGRQAYCEDLFARNFGGRRPDGTTALSKNGEAISSTFFGQSSFSVLANVAARSAVKVPNDIDLAVVAPLGCGIQTGAGAILNELRPSIGSTVAIFGAGAVGAGAIMAARLAGATTIIAVDLNRKRLKLSLELGATHTINTDSEDLATRLSEISAGRGVDVIVDTTGIPSLLLIAASALAIGGAIGLVGAAKPGTTVPFEIGESLNKGWAFKTIIQGGSVPQTFIPALIDLWQQGRFPFDKVTKAYPFNEINQAFADAATGETIKPIVVF